jgi:hypothetical protein
MTAKIAAALRLLALALALLALTPAAAMAALGPEKRKPALPDPAVSRMVFPVLEEKDFLFFLDMMAAIEAGENMGVFLARKKVSRDYATAVGVKMLANVLMTTPHDLAEAAREYGPSIVFGDSEKRLLEKYGDRVRKAVAK